MGWSCGQTGQKLHVEEIQLTLDLIDKQKYIII